MDKPIDVSVDIGNMSFETNRLILRGWQETDLDDFFEYAAVDGVGEMAGWPHHRSKEISQKILQSFMTEKNVLALVYKSNQKVIGSVGLHQSWANNDAQYAKLKVREIGYVLSKDYWGKGLMPEAVQALIALCFETYHLDAVTCGHFSTNLQSKRVIEKCGFQFVKSGEYYSEQLQKSFEDMKYIRFAKK